MPRGLWEDEFYMTQSILLVIIVIGTIALNQIIELAKFENKDLSLEVIGENIARDLYERLGFKTHYRRMILKINDDIYEN